jgi:hypothetical protein
MITLLNLNHKCFCKANQMKNDAVIVIFLPQWYQLSCWRSHMATKRWLWYGTHNIYSLYLSRTHTTRYVDGSQTNNNKQQQQSDKETYGTLEKVSVFKTTQHDEIREKWGNPTIVGFCILRLREWVLPWTSPHVGHVRPPRSLHISPQHCDCHQAHKNSVTLILLLSVNRIHTKK